MVPEPAPNTRLNALFFNGVFKALFELCHQICHQQGGACTPAQPHRQPPAPPGRRPCHPWHCGPRIQQRDAGHRAAIATAPYARPCGNLKQRCSERLNSLRTAHRITRREAVRQGVHPRSFRPMSCDAVRVSRVNRAARDAPETLKRRRGAVSRVSRVSRAKKMMLGEAHEAQQVKTERMKGARLVPQVSGQYRIEYLSRTFYCPHTQPRGGHSWPRQFHYHTSTLLFFTRDTRDTRDTAPRLRFSVSGASRAARFTRDTRTASHDVALSTGAKP